MTELSVRALLLASILVASCTGGSASTSTPTPTKPSGSNDTATSTQPGTITTQPGTTTDTGRITVADCTGFVPTTPAAPTCAGGGLPTDLGVRVDVTDDAGAPCGVCAAGPILASVVLVNPCAVDITFDEPCPVYYVWLDGPIYSVEEIVDCYGTSYTGTGATVTVPAQGSVEWFADSWLDASDPGRYTLSYDLGTVADPTAHFCTE